MSHEETGRNSSSRATAVWHRRPLSAEPTKAFEWDWADSFALRKRFLTDNFRIVANIHNFFPCAKIRLNSKADAWGKKNWLCLTEPFAIPIHQVRPESGIQQASLVAFTKGEETLQEVNSWFKAPAGSNDPARYSSNLEKIPKKCSGNVRRTSTFLTSTWSNHASKRRIKSWNPKRFSAAN